MESPTEMIERWAKEDRAFMVSMNQKKWYGRIIIGLLFALVIGEVLIGNVPQTIVEVPVVDSSVVQRLQQEKEVLERKVADYKTLIANLSVQIKSRNYVIAQYEQQLKALTVSVPSQPVILQSIQKESANPAGLQRVVARSFGKELASKITIIGAQP